MRPYLYALLLAGVAIFADISESAAQSAYSYPWCAIYTNRSGAQACYYSTKAQCLATMRGIGGYCIPSPYYSPEGRPATRSRRNSSEPRY